MCLLFQLKPSPALPDIVCFACICRLNAFFEFQNRAQRNIDRLRLDYFERAGDTRMVNHLKKLKNKQDNNLEKYRQTLDLSQAIDAGDLFSSEETTDDADQETDQSNASATTLQTDFCSAATHRITASTPVLERTRATDDLQQMDTVNQEPCSSMSITQRTSPIDSAIVRRLTTDSAHSLDDSGLLEPMFQRTENLRDTESGGNIHMENEQNAARGPTKCMFCSKVYKKPAFMVKHLRKHWKLNRLKKLATRPGKTYVCKVNSCDEQFNTLGARRKHHKDHKDVFECPVCNKMFLNANELCWHGIVCNAERMSHMSSGCRTRSRSRAKSVSSCSDSEMDSVSTVEIHETMSSEVSLNAASTVNSDSTSIVYQNRIERAAEKRRRATNGSSSESELSAVSDVASVSGTSMT